MRGGVFGEGILTLAGFLMVKNLLCAGLANVDDSEFTSMLIGDRRRAAAKNGGAKTRRGSFTERKARDPNGGHNSPSEGAEAWGGEWETTRRERVEYGGASSSPTAPPHSHGSRG